MTTDIITPPAEPTVPTLEITPEMEALIEARATEKLKDIKSKLDGAYTARDLAKAELDKREQKDRELELARLRDAGKEKEAFDLEIAAERTKSEELAKRNIELTRDVKLSGALAILTFRSDKARDMAYHEIVNQLVRNEQGEWVHRSGKGLQEYVVSFAADEGNAFLFAAKKNSGGDLGQPKPPTDAPTGKLADMSQDELLKLAREGKLPKRK